MKNTAVLLLSTPIPFGRKGAVAAITQFLVMHNGSILHADDHVDTGREVFLSRLEWDLDGFDIPVPDFDRILQASGRAVQDQVSLGADRLPPQGCHPGFGV